MESEVSVLLFGPLRERIGAVEVRGRGETVRDVWDNLMREHGAAAGTVAGIRAARNLSYCEWDAPVERGDVVAFLPPVAGGSGAGDTTAVRVAMTPSPIDVASVIAGVGGAADGAVAVFIGRVRDHSDGHAVARIDYEAYDDMAEREMRTIAEAVGARDGVSAIAIVHRTGALAVGDASVVIAVSGPHRAAALDACRDAIDMIKQTVPIWKREHRDDGAHWVDARHHQEVRT